MGHYYVIIPRGQATKKVRGAGPDVDNEGSGAYSPLVIDRKKRSSHIKKGDCAPVSPGYATDLPLIIA